MKPLLVALLAVGTATARAEDITVPGATIDLQFTKAPSPELHRIATAWVVRSGRAVSGLYGTFPVRHAVVRITPMAGKEPADGVSYGYQGPEINLSLGRDAREGDLADDWILVHEMLHLGFPDLAEQHHWLEEGLATYVEPIARARAGLITPTRFWNDLVEGLPQGQPETGDRGLDATHTWGRTYWGGALFCLRADMEIRRRTANRCGLEQALRAIIAAGGTIDHRWKIDRVIATGDHATGVPVLRELYDEMKATPVRVDLPALWKELGVIHRGKSVTFDNTAPLAATRQAITGG